jgi:serine/threonine protein kinase/Tol biopolymer transport system component
MIPQAIAHYRILSKLGEGGMGEVWRATDTKLNRDVAIKVLPPALANDVDYLARFEREAQVLASLNHPNIATIYGLEGNAIVMELVEGETLRAPLPVNETLAIARQIAEALEAAHDKGVIHRDLKPGNVKVTPEGVVKVLDFGLAKAVEKTRAAFSSAESPTLTMRATEAGVILGTAAYMSPEQAAGKAVDRRADIWAFGVVLYELLTGVMLFQGETISHTLADVLRKEIDLSKLPAETPPAIRELLRRCLDRNLKNRLQHIGEARVAIDHVGTQPERLSTPKRSPWLWVAALSTLALAALAYLHFTAVKLQELPLRSFSFTPKDVPQRATNRRVAISPDGRHIAYVAENKLWVRPLESEQARTIEGTDGAEGPFWSPDSAQIGFVSGSELKKVALAGSSAFPLAKVGGGFRGGAWSPDGRTILVSTVGQGLSEIPAGGGSLKVVAPQSGGTYYWPSHLTPAGPRRLAVAGKGTRAVQILVLVDLDTGKSETLRAPGAYPVWSPAGYVLYQSNARSLGFWALRVSARTGKAEGEPIPLRNEGSDLSASADGTLLWMDGVLGSRRRLAWRDRAGKLADSGIPPSVGIQWVALSPDGTQAAYVAAEQGNVDIWIAELERVSRTLLTFAPEADTFPVWSPTGKEIAFASERNGNFDVFVQAANGVGEPRPVVVSPDSEYPDAWSPDGTLLINRVSPKTGNDLLIVKQKADGKFDAPSVWLQTPFSETHGEFSPDGQYVTYDSDESGRLEVYVRPTDGNGKWQISAVGGSSPRWSRDGREIFYTQGESLMAAPVSVGGGTLRPGTAVELFRNRTFMDTVRAWDVHPDGKRFLVGEDDEADARPASVHVILNWPALLREKGLR